MIRSLVPGGVAEQDGRLLPGDRLMFVNDINLENSCLEEAVQALKGAPTGTVKIGVAKPLPVRIWEFVGYFLMLFKLVHDDAHFWMCFGVQLGGSKLLETLIAVSPCV